MDHLQHRHLGPRIDARIGVHDFLPLITPLITPLIATLLVSSAFAQETREEKIQRLERFVTSQREVDRIPGLTIAVYHGDFEWSQGFGVADLENATPVHPRSAYRLASITKPLTAIAILNLVEDGKIDLDAEVREYVPYWPEKRWTLTVRHLLGHLGGISHYRNYAEEGHFKRRFTTEESIGIFQDWKLLHAPGTRYRYSSYGYNLLGAVIEGASGKSYDEYMREAVWGPLGMDETRLDDPVALIPNRVRGYRLVDGEIMNSEFIDISSRFAGGGTRSTVLDLIQLSRGLDAGEVLSSATQDVMTRPMILSNERASNYGMGWTVTSYSGRRAISHGGSQAETRTHLLRIPSQRFAVAVFSNLEGSNPSRYAYAAASILLDLHPLTFDAPTPDDQRIASGLTLIWNHGLAWLDAHGGPVTTDREELENAFTWVREQLAPATDETPRAQLEDGLHPLTGRPLVVVGSWLAARLRQERGEEELARYRSGNVFEFLSDGMGVDATDPNRPRLGETIEQKANEWSMELSKAMSGPVLALYHTADPDLPSIVSECAGTMSASEIRPRVGSYFRTAAREFRKRGDLESLENHLIVATGLWPRDARLCIELAELFLERGKTPGAIHQLEQARKLAPDDLEVRLGLARLQPIAVEKKLLEVMVGSYRMDGGMKVAIEMVDGNLFAMPEDQPRMKLLPESKTGFLAHAADTGEVLPVTVERDENGAVTKISVRTNQGTLTGQKVDSEDRRE